MKTTDKPSLTAGMEILEGLEYVFKPRTELAPLSKAMTDRYTNIPDNYKAFLETFTVLSNSRDTSWFISIEDFNGEADSGFSWNEFEKMSLDALADDKEECQRIKEFWDNHLPIAISVGGDYQYLCIDLSKENYGKIYYGVEPEFEDSIEPVCDSLEQLFSAIAVKEELESFR